LQTRFSISRVLQQDESAKALKIDGPVKSQDRLRRLL
jgi:hypothetical protein